MVWKMYCKVKLYRYAKDFTFKSTMKRSNFKTSKLIKFSISMIGYIYHVKYIKFRC